MGTPPGEHAEMPFIFIDGMGKAETDKRKLIRKYVMLGKNRGKTRKAKATTLPNPEDSNMYQDGSSDLVIKMQYSKIPDKVGNDLSFTQLAAPVEPALMQDVLKFCFMAKKIMFPLADCIDFHKKDKVDTLWFDLLISDTAYMHTVVFSCQAYLSLLSGQKTSTTMRREMVHYSDSLRLLRKRLSGEDEDYKICDSTVLVVLNLATHAYISGDYSSTKHHIEGLRRIVEMRGGIYAFSYNPKFMMELLKCDLAIALDYGTAPVFFQDPDLEPLVPYNLTPSKVEESSGSRHSWKPVPSSINPPLAQAWIVMMRFCSAINSAVKNNRRLPKETLLNTMAAVTYRLLHMDNLVDSSVDEAIRLGLLAFSSHIFLRMQNVKPLYTWFPDAYRRCLSTVKFEEKSSPLLLWLFMIGAISLFTPADHCWLIPRLRVNIKACGLDNWNELSHQMKWFPWIDILHDMPGQTVFESVFLWTNTPEAESAYTDLYYTTCSVEYPKI